jgi:hypothetical protein
MQGRVGRWLNHHGRIAYPCDVEFAVVGDGIAPEITWPQIVHPPGNYHAANLAPHLGRPSHLDYPGWWRSFGHAATIARDLGCRRIWHVESDFYLASRRMVNKMNEIEKGWITFWCPRHAFPETGIQVIAEEHFDQLALVGERCQKFSGRHAEHVLPITTIICDMVGDRYGESEVNPATIEGLDFYGQCPAHITVPFREE